MSGVRMSYVRAVVIHRCCAWSVAFVSRTTTTLQKRGYSDVTNYLYNRYRRHVGGTLYVAASKVAVHAFSGMCCTSIC